MAPKFKITAFDPQHTASFTKLNFEWLQKYFYIEPYDKKVLENPQEYILNKGGYIFFAWYQNEIVGTVALIKRKAQVFELSKMAITEKYQGKRLGQKLMYYCINFAGENGMEKIFLDSNTKLKPAITLYRKVGFKEIPVPEDSPYERCNIRMELNI